jgi:hypothetical protein
MQKLCLAGLALGFVLLPETVSAQCVRFSNDVPCEVRSGPFNQLQFGATKPAPQKPRTAQPVTTVVAPTNDVQPAIDCAMVKKADAPSKSAMPVIQPDPNVKHTMRVMVVPPCKGS